MAAWPFLVVIDLDEVTVRCRACRWVSPTLTTAAAVRLAYDTHHCTGGPAPSPFLGWCAICGRVRLCGLRPAGPPRPRAWVHTWVCANGCPTRAVLAADDQAGAWDARPCPQAPARQPQQMGQSGPEQPGGPA